MASQSCFQDKALATAQNFQGKHDFGNYPVQVLGNNVPSRNFQQMNNMQSSIQFQEFHGTQKQEMSSSNSLEEPLSDVGTCSTVASLDPIELKLLLGSDDDHNWGLPSGGSFISGMGSDIHGHP